VRFQLIAIGIGTIVAVSGALAPSTRAQPKVSPPFLVYRVVDAEVSKVEAGTLFLKTDAGRPKLDVSNQPLPVLKKAERVALGVTVIRHPDPAALPREDGSHSRPLQRLLAVISAIQRDTGVISLTCPAGRLKVALPEAAIAGLRTGEELSVEFSLASNPDVAALAGQSRNSRVGFAALLFSIFAHSPR
jgi:hypothetical protein